MSKFKFKNLIHLLKEQVTFSHLLKNVDQFANLLIMNVEHFFPATGMSQITKFNKFI